MITPTLPTQPRKMSSVCVCGNHGVSEVFVSPEPCRICLSKLGDPPNFPKWFTFCWGPGPFDIPPISGSTGGMVQNHKPAKSALNSCFSIAGAGRKSSV